MHLWCLFPKNGTLQQTLSQEISQTSNTEKAEGCSLQVYNLLKINYITELFLEILKYFSNTLDKFFQSLLLVQFVDCNPVTSAKKQLLKTSRRAVFRNIPRLYSIFYIDYILVFQLESDSTRDNFLKTLEMRLFSQKCQKWIPILAVTSNISKNRLIYKRNKHFLICLARWALFYTHKVYFYTFWPNLDKFFPEGHEIWLFCGREV